MSQKQWGHGYHKGKKAGAQDGRSEMWIGELEIDLSEIDWVIAELAGYFNPETDKADIEPRAIARAMTYLVEYKLIKKSRLDREREKHIAE